MLTLTPVTLATANAFVNAHHRHHKATAGHKFSIGCAKDGELVGVAIVGRPVSRYLDDGWTLEVNRLCTTGEKNACSILYAASARAAKAMGYQAISDALNRQSIPYCREVPLWNKHKVKRLLENPRYTGKEGYPILVEADIFQAAQEKTAEKNARKQSHGENWRASGCRIYNTR